MKEIWGLRGLKESGVSNGIICPICKNYLNVVGNGFFHGELFFCPKDESVFAIQLKNITKKSGDSFIEQCKDHDTLDKIKRAINRENMSLFKDLLEVGDKK